MRTASGPVRALPENDSDRSCDRRTDSREQERRHPARPDDDHLPRTSSVHWFHRVLNGQDTPWLYRRDDDRGAVFNGAVAGPEAVASAWAAWREEAGIAERFVKEAPDLDAAGSHGKGKAVSLREVLVHRIEEYARHSRHAELRERIDGRVSQ